MSEKNSINLKVFFIKLISITVAVIVSINVVFNLILSERLEKIDKIFSMVDVRERKNFKNRLVIEIEKSLEQKEMLNKEDKVIILKLYNKIKNEFKYLEAK